MAQHSKARTKAEAQFKQVQKPPPATQPTTKGGQATADYLASGSCCTRKDRTAEGTSGWQKRGCHGNEKELQISAPPTNRREFVCEEKSQSLV